MKQLVFATENPGKLYEVGKFAAQYDIEVLSPSQAGLAQYPIKETGDTYEENAKLKVESCLGQEAAKQFVICGDDSGVEIEALNNEPGLSSRRWLGYEMSDEEIVEHTLMRMAGITNRKITSKTILAYSANGADINYTTGELVGHIIDDRSESGPRQAGMPFRELFIVDGDPPIPLWEFEEMSLDERKGRLSYREAAFLGLFQSLDWTK